MCQGQCFVIKNRTHVTVLIANNVRHDTGTYEEQQIDFYFQRWTCNAVFDTVTTFIKQTFITFRIVHKILMSNLSHS